MTRVSISMLVKFCISKNAYMRDLLHILGRVLEVLNLHTPGGDLPEGILLSGSTVLT